MSLRPKGAKGEMIWGGDAKERKEVREDGDGGGVG